MDDLAILAPTLTSLGWTDTLGSWAEPLMADGNSFGRIARVSRGFSVVFVGGDAVVVPSSAERADVTLAPATGDFVALTEDEAGPRIAAIAPRGTALQRRMPGRVPEPQVLAANIDHVWVMQAADDEINHRRLERQLVLAVDSGARPALVLTKADVGQYLARQKLQTAATMTMVNEAKVETVVTSSENGEGLDRLRAMLAPGTTTVLLGASGIGKSTLVNALTGGSVQRTGEVRAADGRGRHTTVTRDLIPVPGRGMLIDTPGVRELGLWQTHTAFARVFREVTDATKNCRFADCFHQNEPGCGVMAGVEAGNILRTRLNHWRALRDELDQQDEQLEAFARRAESRQYHKKARRKRQRR